MMSNQFERVVSPNSPGSLAKGGSFWNESFSFKTSTFGSTSKTLENFLDLSPKPLEKSAMDWTGKDQYGHTHARLKIATVFGKLPINPGPGQYNPNHEKLSRRVVGPQITLGERHEKLFNSDSNRSFSLTNLAETKSNKLKKKISSKDDSKSKNSLSLSNISISQMRKALGPGPGSYEEVEIDRIVKFNRSPLPLLAPRTTTKPRPVITLDTLDIVRYRNDKSKGFKYGGDYDVTNDPRKVEIKMSIGERRPLLGQREILKVGPGYYNPQRATPFGESSKISPNKKTLGL